MNAAAQTVMTITGSSNARIFTTPSKATPRRFERGYHQGELVERSTMNIVAKFNDDFDRDLARQSMNEYAGLRALEQAAEMLPCDFAPIQKALLNLNSIRSKGK